MTRSACFLMLCALGTSVGAQGAGPIDRPDPQRAVRTLLDRRADGRRAEQIVAELVGLGPAAATALFEALLADATGDTSNDGLAGEALRRLERNAVRGVLARRAESQPGALEAVLILELYAELGHGSDLDLGLALGAGLREGVQGEGRASNRRASERISERAREALARWFERDARAASLVHDRRAFLTASERALVEDVFLAVDHPLALGVLSERARSRRHPDDLLLARLGELGDRFPWRLGGDELRLWEALSFSPLWSERRSACMMIGAWRHRQGFERLVEMMADDPHPIVRQAANAALARTAGSERALDDAGWHRWLKARVGAWGRTAPVALAELGSSDPSVVARAVEELAGFRMYRHELAPSLAAALGSHPQLAEPITTALCELDSRACLPVLIDLARKSDDPLLGEALHRTLVHLGVRAPIEDPRWQRIFSSY